MLGQIVLSKAGKDSGSFYVVLKEEEDFAYIADGRLRKIEKPKKKRLKHLAPTNKVLSTEYFETNKKLRAALSKFNPTNEEGN